MLKTVSRLLRTDGSLLFVVHLDQLITEIKHERHNAANGANVSNHRPKCRSYMYRLPGNIFPVKAAYTPPFRFHGMAGNRLLPHTVCKGGKTRHGRWDFTKHIIQINVEKSNKMSDLCRWKADVCLDNFRSLGYNRNTRRCLPETSTSPWRNPDGCHNIQVTSLSA